MNIFPCVIILNLKIDFLFIIIAILYVLGNYHVARHYKLNPGKQCLFTYSARVKTRVSIDPHIETTKVTKMAIGIEGRFDVNGSK